MKTGLLRTTTNRHVEILPVCLANGGQATVYKAVLRETGRMGVAKCFTDATIPRQETTERTEFIIRQRLDMLYPRIAAPTEIIAEGNEAAHFAPFAPGVRLTELLAPGKMIFTQALAVCAIIAWIVYRLHLRGIVHGDIHDGNFMVFFPPDNPDKPEVWFVDMDSFFHASVPRPRYYGNPLFLAPELIDGNPKHPGHPTKESDYFAVGALFHWIMLLVHHTAGYDKTLAEQMRAMYDVWMPDPYSKRPLADGFIYPPGILNSRIATLFRRGLSRIPEVRTTAAEWTEELLKVLDGHLHACPCPECELPIMNDYTKTKCPLCGALPARLKVVLPSGQPIPIEAQGVDLGRSELHSLVVSRQHARFRVNGFDVTMENVSRTNAIFKLVGNAWQPIPAGQPVSVEPGDKFRLGDREIVVMEDKRP